MSQRAHELTQIMSQRSNENSELRAQRSHDSAELTKDRLELAKDRSANFGAAERLLILNRPQHPPSSQMDFVTLGPFIQNAVAHSLTLLGNQTPDKLTG